MKRLKKSLSLLIVITMILALITMMFTQTDATPGAGVKFKLVDVGGDVYKLVFQTKSATVLKMINMVFSYDKAIVQPVAASDTSFEVNVSYMNNSDNFASESPFNMLLKTDRLPPSGSSYTFAPTLWAESTSRAAFYVSIYQCSNINATSSGAYLDIFEFYFKLQDGKSINDIVAETFRFENGQNDVDGFIGTFFPVTGQGFGLRVDEDESVKSFWGAVDQTNYPNTIDEVMSPYVEFTVTEAGGVARTTDSTGIKITFTSDVKNLAENDITINDGTGSAVKGALSGSGKYWTVNLPNVTQEGTVSVSIVNFDDFIIACDAQIVTVYKDIASDIAPPRVINVTPSGAETELSGNVVITFNEAMDIDTIGTVQLNNIALTGSGTWSDRDTVFTIPYSGLTSNASYAVNISGFKDIAGNAMVANSSHSFTTKTLPTYSVIVNSAGTDAAGNGEYKAGATVNISAGGAPANMQFKEWATTSFGVNFTDINSSNTTFQMPANAVTVTAIFESISTTVTGVTVIPNIVTIEKGKSYKFDATVIGNNNPAQTVTWAVSGGNGLSDIAADGTLTVDGNEDIDVTLTVTAISTLNKEIFGSATVKVTSTPPLPAVVDTVTVTPAFITLNQGGAYKFTALVTGTNNPSQSVIWEVYEAIPGTTITDGVLSIDPAETATTLTVKAISTLTGYTDKFGLAIVTISQEPAIDTIIDIPEISGVTAPAQGATPVTTVTETVQYTGTVAWTPTVSGTFAASTAYTAIITLTPKPGFSLTGIGANFFIISEADSVSNLADSGMITAVFPATGSGSTGSGSTTSVSVSPAKANYNLNDNQDITVTLTTGNHTLKEVQNGNYTLVKGIDYTVNGKLVTIKGEYLATLDLGQQVITFVMSGGTNPILTIKLIKEKTDTSASESTAQSGPETNTPPVSQVQNPFNDVQQGHWFYNEVMYIYANQLMSGIAADKFSPHMNLTRGMVVTVLYRQAGSSSVSGLANPFSDVPENAYYAAAAKWAATNKIVLGYENGKFRPNGNITREQLAAILYRYQQFSGKIPANTGPAKEFSDGRHISAYAKEAVNTLVRQNIISGKPGDLFDPQGSATRAEFASMLYRFLISS